MTSPWNTELPPQPMPPAPTPKEIVRTHLSIGMREHEAEFLREIDEQVGRLQELERLICQHVDRHMGLVKRNLIVAAFNVGAAALFAGLWLAETLTK